MALLIQGCSEQVVVPEPDLSQAEVAVRYDISKWRDRAASEPKIAQNWGRYGMALDAHGYVGEAEAAYRWAAQIDSTDARWPYYVASLLKDSRPDEAIDWYREALALRPQYAPGHIRLGQTLQTLDMRSGAETHFRRAMELEPENAFGHLGLGQLCLQKNEIPEAIRHLEAAAAATPLTSAALSSLAQAHQRNGDTAVAAELAERARDLPRKTYQSDPLLAEVRDAAVDRAGRMSRAVTYRDVGQLERALELAHNAAESSPKHAGAALLVADIYERLERFSEAEQWARRSAELSPNTQGLNELLARVQFESGKLDQAEVAASAAIASNPLSADSHMVLGRIAQRRGEDDRAIHHLREAIRARPQETAWRLVLAQALENAGQTNAAAKEFAAVTTADPTNMDAWLALADSHLQSERWSQAMTAYERVLDIAYGNVDSVPSKMIADSNAALAGLVQASLSHRGPRATRERLTQHVTEHPNDVVAILLLTDFMAAEGRLAEAKTMLEQLARREPNRADVWLQLGNVNLSAGNQASAKQAFSRALDISGEPQLRALAQQGLLQSGL